MDIRVTTLMHSRQAIAALINARLSQFEYAS